MALLPHTGARTLKTPSAAAGFSRWASVATVTLPTTSSGPGVGDRAPDFTLRHTFTEQVTLADRWPRGPVVLAFYVFDFGSV
jgi:AhpC/TSA family